jgi:hypothetical protein
MSFLGKLRDITLDHVRLVLLGLAAIALLVLGASLFDLASHTVQEPSSAGTTAQNAGESAQSGAELSARSEMRQKIEAQLLQSPDYMRFFDRLKLIFPVEYDSIIDSFAKHAAANGETQDIDAMMTEAVRSLRLSHGVLAAKANGAVLQRIFSMQLAMMQALDGKDKRLCVDFLYGGASQGFYRFSSENRALVADVALAGLDAINDGRINHVDRAAPNETDFQLLEKSLRDQGLSTPEIEALLDGKTSDPPITEARMCTVGQIYFQTLASLPEDTRFRLYGLAVELMVRS